jgi:2-polyprenyl-3-methyl-5-hydroxy-6-metoxy-1,4-benzoquinol methylase
MLLRKLQLSVRRGRAVLDHAFARRVYSAGAQESGGKENISKPKSSSTVDPKEVAKFAALSQEWWNPTGPFAGLHALNQARVPFITKSATHCCNLIHTEGPQVLHGLRVLDVGCGGGILAEALARLGADVTGVDVTRENIEVAKSHMQLDPVLQDRLRYGATPCTLLLQNEGFGRIHHHCFDLFCNSRPFGSV